MVGLLGLLAAINLSIATNLGNELRLQAVDIAEDVLNDAQKQPFDNITANWTQMTGSSPNLPDRYLRGSKRSYTVAKSITSFTDTKKITVGVSWKYKNQILEHTVSTIIGKSYSN